jgi:hypothetical protein
MNLQTQYHFTLPRGYLSPSGTLHQTGVMRLATARDEIDAFQDPRVQANEAYLPVVLLTRVITRLDGLPQVTPEVIEGLFAGDLAYLEDLYQRLNTYGTIHVGAVCPHCTNQFQLQVAPLEASLE